jgi:hypothetical protein
MGSSLSTAIPELPPPPPPPPLDTHVFSDSQLAIFRYLTGIHSAPDHRVETNRWRPCDNIGIYKRVVTKEEDAKFKYLLFSRLINACLGLQIIVAASLTALGAGNGPHTVVTLFGAVNTIIAGFLTYLKGSGLPNRYKHFQFEWAKLREYIEQRERDFMRGNTSDAFDEVKIIEEKYEAVRRNVEASDPDSFPSVAKTGEKVGDSASGTGGARGEKGEAPAAAQHGAGKSVEGNKREDISLC